MQGVTILDKDGNPFGSTLNPFQTSLVGSNVPLPSQKIDLVGTYTNGTGVTVQGSTVVAAGATQNFPISSNLLGNRLIQALAYISGTSPSWTLVIQKAIKGIATVGDSQTTGTISTTAGGTAALTVDWADYIVTIVNHSSTNSLTVLYAGVGVQ